MARDLVAFAVLLVVGVCQAASPKISSQDGVVAMRLAQNVEFDLVASDVLPELKTSVRDIFDRIVAEGEARSNETEKLEQRLHDQEQSTDAGFTSLSQSVETEIEKLALETREQITSVEAAGNATFASLTKAIDDLTTSLAAVSDEVKNEIMPDVNEKIGVVQESLKAVKATAEGAAAQADKVKIFAPAANLVSKGEIEFPEKPFITIEIKNPLAGGVDLEVAYGTASAVQQNKWTVKSFKDVGVATTELVVKDLPLKTKLQVRFRAKNVFDTGEWSKTVEHTFIQLGIFGTGSDGAIRITGKSKTPTPYGFYQNQHAKKGATTIRVHNSPCPGNLKVSRQIFIHQSVNYANGGGHFEFNQVIAHQGPGCTLKLKNALSNDYYEYNQGGTSPRQAQVQPVIEATTFTVAGNGAQLLPAMNFDNNVGGIIAVSATKTITIESNGLVYGGGAGHGGGTRWGSGSDYQWGMTGGGWSHQAGSHRGSTPYRNGNGGGAGNGNGAGAGGGNLKVGGGGSRGGCSQGSATGGKPAKFDQNSRLALGGGGGSGGSHSISWCSGNRYGATGGRGAGIIVLQAPNIVIKSGGKVHSDGNNGNNCYISGCSQSMGPGGGGAGGSVLIRGKQISATNGAVRATGGNGGSRCCGGCGCSGTAGKGGEGPATQVKGFTGEGY